MSLLANVVEKDSKGLRVKGVSGIRRFMVSGSQCLGDVGLSTRGLGFMSSMQVGDFFCTNAVLRIALWLSTAAELK